MQSCVDCGLHHDSFITDYRQGDILCPQCGLVQESHILINDKHLLDNQFIDPYCDQVDKIDQLQFFKSETDILSDFIKSNDHFIHNSPLNQKKAIQSLDFITRISQSLHIHNCVVFYSYNLFLNFASSSSPQWICRHSDSICCAILYLSSRIFHLNKPLKLFFVYSQIKKKKFNKILESIKLFVFQTSSFDSQQFSQSSQHQLLLYVANSLRLNQNSSLYQRIFSLFQQISSNTQCHVTSNPFSLAISCSFSAFVLTPQSDTSSLSKSDFLNILKQISGSSESFIQKQSQTILNFVNSKP